MASQYPAYSSIEAFLNLTMGQVKWMTDHIIARQANDKAGDREWLAAVNGGKVNIPRIGPEGSESTQPVLSEAQQEVADRVTQRALAKKQKELNRG